MSAESQQPHRVFVDTNVLLYALDKNAGPKRESASRLIRSIWRSGNGCLSVQVMQEFYVNATRKLPHSLTQNDAKRIVASLSRWHVHSPTTEDVLSAIDLQAVAQLSFWDAMIVTSAARLGCAVLYSEDLNSGQEVAGVRIVNPF